MSSNLSDIQFYKNIKSFSNFGDVMNLDHYVEVPPTWCVFISDIRGSTKAIQAGRYRDVNMIGAACIASVLNSLDVFELPYVFGGDGATLLCPISLKQKVADALMGVQKRSAEKFGLELRVGCVSVESLNKIDAKIFLAKHQMADKVTLAMFRGNGISVAESMIKSNSPAAELYSYDKSKPAEPNLGGLSCRWSPFKATHGHILSLIIKVRTDQKEPEKVYSGIINQIEQILANTLDHHNPVTQSKLNNFGWSPKGLKTEWSIATSMGSKWIRFASVYLRAIVSKIVITFDLKLGAFKGDVYKQDASVRCDHKKFDDTLRLILDCDEVHKSEIESFLESEHQAGRLDFGIHVSDTALMTCYVPGPADGTHIHFIDGNDGGYALAAKAMKERISASKL